MHGAIAKRSFFLDCKEEVSQGYPMPMILYGLLLLPFIAKLKKLFPSLFSPQFANNRSRGSKLDSLHEFFDKAYELGKAYGYYLEMDKCILIITNNNIITLPKLNF